LFLDRAKYLDFKENFFTKKFIVEEIAGHPPSSDVVIRVPKSPPRPCQIRPLLRQQCVLRWVLSVLLQSKSETDILKKRVNKVLF